MPRLFCHCWRLLVLPALFVIGCSHNSSDPSVDPSVAAILGGSSGSGGGTIGAPTYVELNVYQLTVPYGTISRDDQFWKRIDETQLDMPTYDLLLKNGIRVGIGDNHDWQYFRTLIDRYQAVGKQATSTATDGGYIDLPLHENVDYQDIFYFNQKSELTGRTFVKCEDLFTVAFFASKRHDGETLIKVCPVIHGLNKRFEVTEMGNELEVDASNPEKLYDLNLEALVPANHFLLIAPSQQAKFPDLIGSAFLDGNGAANRTETLLILAPQEIKLRRLSDKTAAH
ncbi:MAG TPA: hypothetical protein VHY37_05555 [Tepidisphaeraceae bacterium]|jgi:hypothetical protein|nr:hypothetical protein [Tepidisphaeraceae bacterium]